MVEGCFLGLADRTRLGRYRADRPLRRKGLLVFAPNVVALVNVVLPEMSGPELAERLRRRRYRAAGVLYTSGYTTESVAQHLTPETPCLRMPFRPEDLLGRIDEILGNP